MDGRDELQAPMAVLRASSIASSEASCGTDAEEPSTTDTSPAATPPRPSLVGGEAREEDGGCGGGDPMSMLKELYEAFFPHDDEEEEDRSVADVGAAGEQQQQRGRGKRRAGRQSTRAGEAIEEASKRLRRYSSPKPDAAAEGGADVVGLASLPGECLREVAAFLAPAELWPAFALVCKRVSCHPAVVPLLLDACPRARLPGALFGVWAPKAEEELAPCRDLRALDLSHLPLGEAGGRRLARALNDRDGLSGLRSLDVAGSGLDGQATEALASALGRQQQAPRVIESLRLSGNDRLSDAGIRSLSKALWEGACPRLEALELAGVGMGVQGAASLAQAFAAGHCARLRRLDLSNNPRLGAAGTAVLLSGLRDGGLRGLEELRLRDCGLGPAGARALGEALAAGALPRLALLDLEGNAIGPEGMAALAVNFLPASSTPSLRHLYLGRNALGNRGAQHLGSALRALPGLKTLAVPDNAIAAGGAAALWVGLEAMAGAVHTRLSSLDASQNLLGPEGARGLARCVQQGLLPGLVDLDLSATCLGAAGTAHVAAALQATPAPLLRRLGLRENGVGDAGLAHLAGAFGALACPALEELALGGSNALGDAGAAALAEAIEGGGLEALKVLDLGGSGTGTEGLRALALACRSHARGLETLDLSGPAEDDDVLGGVQALGAYWLTAVLGEGAFPSLTTLRLGGQGIGRSGLYMLHVAIRNGALRRLTTLDLSRSPEMGDAGLGYLAIALRRGGCPRLRTLGLAECGIGDKGLKHLAHALAARPAPSRACLERVELARNPALTGAGLARFCDVLGAGSLPGLQHLGLDGCRRLGDRGARALAGAIRAGGLAGLVTLRAAGIGLTDEGLRAVVEAVGASPTRSLALWRLDLARNRLTSVGAVALGRLLASNACRSLESLSLGGNPIDAAGAEALVRTVSTKRCCPLLRVEGADVMK